MDKEASILFSNDNGALGSTLLITSVTLMVILSAIGSTAGASMASSTATMVVRGRSDVLTKSYLPIILASTGFLYAFILALAALNKAAWGFGHVQGLSIAAACMIHGVTCLLGGICIGKLNKTAIVKLSEDSRSSFQFLLLNTFMEVPIFFGFITALMLINKV